jgi:serine phosphatase RsbU (regulator of sigma subunit)
MPAGAAAPPPSPQASPPADGDDRARVRFGASLTVKQALATLVVVVVVGLLGGMVELFFDWRIMRDEAVADTTQTIAMVRGSAAEAAYQLSPDLAAKVVDGLFQRDVVATVRIHDNFGKLLAERKRDRMPGGSTAQALFGDVTAYAVPLVYDDGVLPAQEVGRLSVSLSAGELSRRFLGRAAVNATLGGLRALLVCVVVVAVFTVMITRPLLRVSRGIAAVRPERPGQGVMPIPAGHGGDEIGLLVTAFNHLLTAFQKGLEQRDTAQAALQALTHDLEERVRERTHEWEVANAALAEEKEETEQAFARLDQAHTELDRANRLLVESIQYARRIQTALLPDKNALGDAVAEIHVCWEPLHVVGGDYFWLERLDGKCFLMIVDCTGHGVPGAFMTLVTASALDRVLHERGILQPSEVLTELDAMVRARLRQDDPQADSDDGLDAAICVWDPAARTVTYAGANLPLLFVGADQVAHDIRGTRASLGYASLPPTRPFKDHVIAVDDGMAFYMLTDGIPDHMGGEPKRLLGRRRLKEMLTRVQGQGMAAQLDALQTELDLWRGDEPRRDDMTLIGFRPL